MHFIPSTSLSAFLLLAPSCIAAVSTITMTATAAPQPTSSSYTSDQTFQDDMLKATNFYRGEHNASALTWNKTSAEYALKWSKGCDFEHSVSLSFPFASLLSSRH